MTGLYYMDETKDNQPPDGFSALGKKQIDASLFSRQVKSRCSRGNSRKVDDADNQ